MSLSRFNQTHKKRKFSHKTSQSYSDSSHWRLANDLNQYSLTQLPFYINYVPNNTRTNENRIDRWKVKQQIFVRCEMIPDFDVIRGDLNTS